MKLHIGFILIKLLIRLFILMICFVFAFAKDEINQNPIVIIKNIGFESRNIEFDVRYCDNEKCENKKTYTYFINDKLKNNMEILAFNKLIQKRNDKVLVKKNGLRIIRGDDTLSKYLEGIGLLSNNYSDYISYKNMFLEYLDREKDVINDTIGYSNEKTPLVYGLFFPKMRGSIFIEKIKANDDFYFYKTKISITFNPIMMISDFSGYRYEKFIVDIDKSSSLEFDTIGKKNDLDSLSYDLMKDISSEVSYFLANIKIDKKTNNEIYEETYTILDDTDTDIPTYKSHNSNSLTLGVKMIPFKISLGRDYEAPKSYSRYFNSFSIGYHKNMFALYDSSINIDIHIGKKEYLIIDETYGFKDPTLLSISGALAKRIYLSSNIYIAPFIGGGITRVSSSSLKGFKSNSYIQDYSVFMGGEFGWKIASNHEIGVHANKSLFHTTSVVGVNETYNANTKNDISFGLSYRYSF